MTSWQEELSILLDKVHQADKALFDFIKRRSTLIAAIVGIILLVIGVSRHDLELSAEVVLAGALGYLIGFIPAVVSGMILTVIRIFLVGFHGSNLPIEVLVFIGGSYIAWLGREHRLATNRRKQEIRGFRQTSQVIPWTMVNEVRNSLLAMRLLLFSKQNEHNDTNLQMVKEELTRLDRLFHNLKEEK